MCHYALGYLNSLPAAISCGSLIQKCKNTAKKTELCSKQVEPDVVENQMKRVEEMLLTLHRAHRVIINSGHHDSD
jgi:hypothetical protein